jgi:GNAT superfamily N-acetyltransferase
MSVGVPGMRLWDSVSRAVSYCERHGFRAATRRTWLGLTRAFRADRQVLFYCDLHALPPLNRGSADHLNVERKNREAELDPKDLLQITNFWNPEISRRQISERFGKGASLWLIRVDDQLAGYGWTIVGCTVKPHYFPLTGDDVHLFDFLLFPEFRGRGVNPSLVIHILERLASEKRSRAFIEAAEWNTAQLCSLSKTPFRKFGCGQKLSIFGRTFVFWTRRENRSHRNLLVG